MNITFSSQEREILVRRVQAWFDRELDQEIGGFDAGFLLDFFTEEIGPAFYNKGLEDAETVLTGRLDDIVEAIHALEQPVTAR